jgi:hypothetical protein
MGNLRATAPLVGRDLRLVPELDDDVALRVATDRVLIVLERR